MTNNYSWPRIRAILDTALETERGISVPYPSWSVAAQTRINMYKIRKQMRDQSRKFYPDPDNPNHGISPYDGLSIWIRSSISRQQQNVRFVGEETLRELNALSDGKSGEDEKLFPGKSVDLTIETPHGPAIVTNAPSYALAWQILREDFPATLMIENGYSLADLDIVEL